MFANRFYFLASFGFIVFFSPFAIMYMEENLAFFLFSFLTLVLIFNVYDVLLDSSRHSILLFVSKFKFLYLYSLLNFYFSFFLAFFSLRSNFSYFMFLSNVVLFKHLSLYQTPLNRFSLWASSLSSTLSVFSILDGFFFCLRFENDHDSVFSPVLNRVDSNVLYLLLIK